ncbi:MAG: class I SAM-dependent methyltransferase [Idiomarina sp.]|nr:class I SAM-dependent methyltransferase [Idiomarina sp.]
MTNPTECCPLCESTTTKLWWTDERRNSSAREFLQCSNCELVFVARAFLLTPEDEQPYYALHENSPEDLGYRSFLNRALEPLVPRLEAKAKGLDFGCGPGPTLSVMCQELGFECQNYDPFFANDPALLDTTYDFITCTEVIEHVHWPRATFAQLQRCLRPGGWLSLMTQRPTTLEAFSRWGYSADPTHIRFYREHTLAWIAAEYNFDLQIVGPDVALLQKR